MSEKENADDGNERNTNKRKVKEHDKVAELPKCPPSSSEESDDGLIEDLEEESDSGSSGLGPISSSIGSCICKFPSSSYHPKVRSSFSSSTVEFVLDPNAKKRTRTSANVKRTPEDEEKEKALKYKLFQVECEIKEADNTIEKLSVKRLLLTSKKKRRDADLQRYAGRLGDKMLKKNCVQHNWELFVVQDKYRELRWKYVALLWQERRIRMETNDLQKEVEHLSALAAKSRNDALDNLDHLWIRREIQTQLYEQEFERLDEERMVLERDLRLLEEAHLRQINAERETLKALNKEVNKMKKRYFYLIESSKDSSHLSIM